MAGIMALTILVFTEYALIRPYPLEHYFSLDLVIALIFLLLGNAIYISLYYYDLYLRSITEKQALARQLQEDSKLANEHLIVKMGKRDIIVPFADILCLYSEEKETFLLTNEHKTYLVDSSLDKLEDQLPASLFFRANRKFIIAAPLVESIQAETYGKLLVHLKIHPKLPASLIISRDKAPAFRQWLKR
jgi:DNA-binding LytR/AlgR family response regulator